MADDELVPFRTPRGGMVSMWCRPDTNDRMVAEACIQQDEYGTSREEAEYVLDIGGHIGAWSVGYLRDHPDARAVIVEPLGMNVRLIKANLDENGLRDRARVVCGAFATDPSIGIRWDFQGRGPHPAMHRFVGNQRMTSETQYQTTHAVGYTLADLQAIADGPFGLVKIDCEGGEVAFVGADLSRVGVIVGEFHIPIGPLYEHLSLTHLVAYQGGSDFGSFRADPR